MSVSQMAPYYLYSVPFGMQTMWWSDLGGIIVPPQNGNRGCGTKLALVPVCFCSLVNSLWNCHAKCLPWQWQWGRQEHKQILDQVGTKLFLNKKGKQWHSLYTSCAYIQYCNHSHWQTRGLGTSREPSEEIIIFRMCLQSFLYNRAPLYNWSDSRPLYAWQLIYFTSRYEETWIN